jgi:fermentation-respiration switch protein FrsA (DUF1100 family)
MIKSFCGRAGRFAGGHWIFVAFLIFVIAFVMTPYQLERFFVYYPTRQVLEDPGSIGLDYQDVYLVTDDNVKLHGWFVPCEDARRTVLIFHGNGGNIGDRLPWIEMFHKLDANVFIIDYRGYGKSEGKPFEKGLYRDARAAYNWWANARQPKGEKPILFGESLGGAIAVNLAARVAPAGLILQSTFTSARDMAKTLFPIGLLLPLTNVKLDSAKEIGRVSCPKLIVHGTRDEIVPFRLGKKLYELAAPPKSFYVVPEAGHNDLIWIAGAEYSRQLKQFLSSIP